MNSLWKLQDAKAKFSQVVENALNLVPQHITCHGKEAVVIISAQEYKKITQSPSTFKELLLNCPKQDEDIFVRQQDDVISGE